MIKDLKGIHHVTAMTSSAEKNYAFFTEVLGMRLVKKPSTKTIFIRIIYFSPMTRVQRERI